MPNNMYEVMVPYVTWNDSTVCHLIWFVQSKFEVSEVVLVASLIIC